MSTRTWITAFQCLNCHLRYQTCPAVPGSRARPLDDVAEADAAGLVAAELDEGDLVGRDENPSALLRGQREDRRAAWRAECRREVAFDLFRGRVGVHDQ